MISDSFLVRPIRKIFSHILEDYLGHYASDSLPGESLNNILDIRGSFLGSRESRRLVIEAVSATRKLDLLRKRVSLI